MPERNILPSICIPPSRFLVVGLPRSRPGPVSRLALVFAALALVLLATGWPSLEPGAAAGGQLKLIPSPGDALRNVLLFAPLGAALAWLGVRRTALTGSAALLSIGIEAVQWWIPGRESSPWDVAANASGAWLGAWLVVDGSSWLRPRDERRARILHRCATLLAALLLAGGSLLFLRSLPGVPYFGHVPPDLPNLERYPGEVRRAEVSGTALLTGELSAPGWLRDALHGDHRVLVEGTAAEPTRGLAGLALVTNHENRGALIVGVRRDALLYSVATYSHRLGFDGGLRWLPGVIGLAAPGSGLIVEVERRGTDLCIGVNSPVRCGFGFRLGEGWTHWLPSAIVPPALRPAFDVLWLAGCLFWVGYFGRGRGRDPVPWSIAFVAATVVFGVAATRSPSIAEAVALIAGWLIGRMSAVWLGVRLVPTSPSTNR